MLEELRRRRVFRTAILYLVAGWGAVEVSATVLPLLGAPEWAPRAVLALVAAGLPVTVALAWRFDVGPDGIHETDGPAGRRAHLGQAILLAGALVIGLAVPAFIVLDVRSGEAPAPDPDPNRPASTAVAVLPFENASANPDDEYFAYGITDELVGALARFDGIRVLHPSASARLLAAGIAAPDVGRRLDAAYMLRGSVRRAGGVVRITTILTNAVDGEVVWQETYDSDISVENLFDVQERIAESVAARFNAAIAPRYTEFVGRTPTASVDAFDRYLRASYDLALRTPGAVTRAIAGFRAASDLDPDFAAAVAREAYGYELFFDWGWAYPGAPPEELLRRALDLAGRALALDSTAAEAWLAFGYGRYLRDPHDQEDVLAAIRRSIELNPADPESFHQLGQILMSYGHYSEAASAYHGALALDPTRAMTLVPLAAMSHRSRNLLEARRWVDSAIVVGPGVPYAWSYRANLRNARGDHAGALEDARRAIEIDPSYDIPARAAIAVAEHGLGNEEAADEDLRRALDALPEPHAPGATDALYLGGALVSNGYPGRALDLLEQAPPSPWLWFTLQHPDFDAIRATDRFRAVEAASDPRR